MAIYNMWSSDLDLAGLKEALDEIYADIPQVTTEEVATSMITIGFDGNNKVQIANNAMSCGVHVDSKFIAFGSNSGVGGFKYFAKTNGEMLISTTNTLSGCVQWGIGKTVDGGWGAVCVGRPTTNAYYDYMISTFAGAKNQNARYVTNYQGGSINYVALRRCVKLDDILFDNIYINTEGSIYSWIVFDMNGEQYTSSNNNTGNNDVLVMKL